MLKARLAGFAGAAAALAFAALIPGQASAQDWQKKWDDTLAKAKGQKLVLMTASNPGMPEIIDAFSKKFGIATEVTVSRPSQALKRMRIEQQNGQFLWDLWWGGTSNMTNSAVPGKMLEPIEQFFILPDMSDNSVWRHKDYRFTDSGHHVIVTYTALTFGGYRNHSVVPDLVVDGPEKLLDPRLKGKIVMRNANRPNLGSFILASLYKTDGGKFLRRLLTEQQPRVFESPKQVSNALFKGGYGVAIGAYGQDVMQCQMDGGCKNIEEMTWFSSAISNGMSVPKNAPHKAAAAIWLNWFFSKEGQDLYVREWAKGNPTGAISMRKDVAPAKGHARYQPDYAHPENYTWVSMEKGSDDILDTVKIFREVTGR